jgi:hypothetical protein
VEEKEEKDGFLLLFFSLFPQEKGEKEGRNRYGSVIWHP